LFPKRKEKEPVGSTFLKCNLPIFVSVCRIYMKVSIFAFANKILFVCFVENQPQPEPSERRRTRGATRGESSPRPTSEVE